MALFCKLCRMTASLSDKKMSQQESEGQLLSAGTICICEKWGNKIHCSAYAVCLKPEYLACHSLDYTHTHTPLLSFLQPPSELGLLRGAQCDLLFVRR